MESVGLSEGAAMLDVVVVNYNTKHILPDFFSALDEAAKGLSVRYLVVDNASKDGSAAWLSSKPGLAALEINDVNIGFGRANNQLLSYVEAPYVLLLNTDAFVEPNALRSALDFMSRNSGCGVMGARLVGRDGALQPSCRRFPSPLNLFVARCGLQRFFPSVTLVDDFSWNHESARECDWVPGCFYLIRREVLDRVGLFDPIFFLYCEEVDHCKRVKEAGWKVFFNPDISVVHVGGESAKSEGNLSSAGRQLSQLQTESEIIYVRKHFGRLGLLAHVALLVLGDIILMLKDVIKRRQFGSLSQGIKNSMLTLTVLVRTRFGACATR